MGRIIKFIWLISLLTGLAVLLYSYASMGENVLLSNETDGSVRISREFYFYSGLAVLVLFNFGFYALSRNLHMSNKILKEALISWQMSFAAVLNFFYITAALFLMLFNSGERFNYANFGYLIYIALGLIVIWVIALPVVILKKRQSE